MRTLNRLLGLALGLALAGAGGIAVAEVILAAVGHPFVLVPASRYLHALRTTQWSSRPATVASLVAAVLGLVLLAGEVWRRPPRRVPLTGLEGDGRRPDGPVSGEPDVAGADSQQRATSDASTEDIDWWLLRRSVETHLRRRLVASTPATRARVRLMAGRRRWRARVRVNAPAAARGDVERAARESLERLGARRDRLRVKVGKLRLRAVLRAG